ncbi:hypothetical protein RJ640_005949 [Escallonia rubra]|uniref:Retrotransposon gag domain-containing protein n=1 Tax=Escallonia rubra TaxID=112253 RepID=A0AA88QKY2_9ASTE|nr:hypothetical protein RJ640_005949 [Escallonia rubra]
MALTTRKRRTLTFLMAAIERVQSEKTGAPFEKLRYNGACNNELQPFYYKQFAIARKGCGGLAEQEIFLTKYFPRNLKDDMGEEFLKLKQGENETVKDYEARFARLSSFATHVIDTEERRATRFKNGLRYSIQKFLTAVTLDTYGQVLDKAQRVEKDVEAGRKYYKEQRQKRGSEESSLKGNDMVQPKSKLRPTT